MQFVNVDNGQQVCFAKFMLRNTGYANKVFYFMYKFTAHMKITNIHFPLISNQARVVFRNQLAETIHQAPGNNDHQYPVLIIASCKVNETRGQINFNTLCLLSS